MAVDTLGHLLALHVTPASAEDRGEVERLARTVQAVTGDSVDVAYVDQGYTGARAAATAATHGIALEVIKLPQAKRGFVLPPGAGSSSGPSPGRPASDTSSKTTNAMPKHSPDFTSSPSPAS